MDPGSILAVSAKLGTGVTDLLDAVVARVPPPRSAGRDADLRLFLFDSWWDKYHGSINLVLVVDGVLSGNKNNTVVSSKTGKEYKVKEVGVLTPEPHPCQFLYPGQVGYLVSNMKVRESVFLGGYPHIIQSFSPREKPRLATPFTPGTKRWSL